jgi:hypothetical protein
MQLFRTKRNMQREKSSCLPCLNTGFFFKNILLIHFNWLLTRNWHDVYEHTRIQSINKTIHQARKAERKNKVWL